MLCFALITAACKCEQTTGVKKLFTFITSMNVTCEEGMHYLLHDLTLFVIIHLFCSGDCYLLASNFLQFS